MDHRLSTGARFATAVLVLLATTCSPPWAATTGKIAGRVLEGASGAPIPGAGVRVDGLRLGGVTDANGHYFIIGVSPGSHDVTASLVGYAASTTIDVRVNIDRTTPLDFALSEAAIEVEGVVVVAQREVIQLDVAGSRSTLSAEDVLELPGVATLGAAIERERTGLAALDRIDEIGHAGLGAVAEAFGERRRRV